jgi:hypothetical protein
MYEFFFCQKLQRDFVISDRARENKELQPLFSNGARIPKYQADTSVAFCRSVCLSHETVRGQAVSKDAKEQCILS